MNIKNRKKTPYAWGDELFALLAYLLLFFEWTQTTHLFG